MHTPGFLQPTTPHGRLPDQRRDGPAHGRDLGRLLLGLTVVTIGVLFLLDAGGVLNAGKAIGHWWPLVIVAGGVLTLAERPPAVVRGTILTGIGVVLLLFTTDLLHKSAWNYLWPALVVIAGLVIVLRWRDRAVVSGANEDDVVRSTAVFGGPNLICTSRRFAGAWLTAVFGGTRSICATRYPHLRAPRSTRRWRSAGSTSWCPRDGGSACAARPSSADWTIRPTTQSLPSRTLRCCTSTR